MGTRTCFTAVLLLAGGFARAQSLDWIATFDSPGMSSDNARALAISGVDSYIASSNGSSWQIFKIDAAGAEVWRQRIPAFDYDAPRAIAVAAGGRARIVGDITTLSDWHPKSVAVGLDADGSVEWTYSPPQDLSFSTYLTDVVCDSAGNSYIVGHFRSLEYEYSVTVLKLDPAGSLVWLDTYPNAGSEPTGRRIALAPDGDVLVAGAARGDGGNGDDDLLLIRYDPQGARRWVATYDVVDGAFNRNDLVNDLAVDSQGGAILVGNSRRTSSVMEWLVTKFDAAGQPVWVDRYDGAASNGEAALAAAIDSADNAIVAGYSRFGTAGDDFVTIKYSPAGGRMWTSRYNRANNHDRAWAVVVGGDDSVVVGGDSGTRQAVVTYTPGGTESWAASYPGNPSTLTGLALEATDGSVRALGGIFPTGQAADLLLRSLSASGAENWTAAIDGDDRADDALQDMEMDAAGSVYLTISPIVAASARTIAKYDAAGQLAWTSELPDSLYPREMELDEAGRPIVSATEYVGSSARTTLYRLDPATGIADWSAAPVITGDDETRAIAARGGAIYAVTSSRVLGTDYDYGIAKLSDVGEVLWTQHYDSGTNGRDEVSCVAIAADGTVIATGGSPAPGTDGRKITTIWLDAGGEELTVARFESGVANPYDSPNAMALDSAGNAVIVGSIGLDPSMIVLKYSPTGSLLWSLAPPELLGADSSASDVAIGAGDVIYVCGSYVVGDPKAGNRLVTVLALAPDGERLWTVNYGDPGAPLFARAEAIDLGPAGEIYVGGLVHDDVAFLARALWRFDPAGRLRSLSTFASTSTEPVTRIGVDANGRVGVGFDQRFLGTRRDAVLLRYSAAAANCDEPYACDRADLDGDCAVGIQDLARVLAAFGAAHVPGDAPFNGDVDFDLTVGLADLTLILSQFGASCFD